MIPIDASKQLPPEGQYVLVHHTRGSWYDSKDPVGVNWVVARLERGISQAEREALPDGDPRKRNYRGADEAWNNERPYAWYQFGLSSFNGQEVDYWAPLPTLP